MYQFSFEIKTKLQKQIKMEINRHEHGDHFKSWRKKPNMKKMKIWKDRKHFEFYKRFRQSTRLINGLTRLIDGWGARLGPRGHPPTHPPTPPRWPSKAIN